MLRDLSNEQLVAQIVRKQDAGQDPEVEFTELYNRFDSYVRSMIMGTSLASEAEDIIQEVFLKLYGGGFRRYEGRGGASFKTFLTTVVRNVLIDQYRKKRRERAARETPEKSSASGEENGSVEGDRVETSEEMQTVEANGSEEGDPTSEKEQRYGRTAGEAPRVTQGPEEEVEAQQRFQLLMEALQALERTNALIIYLSIWERRTDAEIGRLLGMTEEAVRKRRKRASQRLRQILEDRGIDS